MNQETKKYLAQFIITILSETIYSLYRESYYIRPSSSFSASESLKDDRLPIFVIKNIKKLCSFVVEENNKRFFQILNAAIMYDIRATSRSASDNLMANPNKEIVFSLKDDVDNFCVDSLIKEYLFLATYRYFDYYCNYSDTIAPNLNLNILKDGIAYCFENSFVDTQKPFSSFISSLKISEFSCSYEELDGITSRYLDLSNGCKASYILSLIMREQKLYSSVFFKRIYNTLDEDKACDVIYSSKNIDLVKEGIVSDESIISKTKEKYSEELSRSASDLSMEDYYFLSKYYPVSFNKIVENIMVAKDRRSANKTIKIASEFSGITKKMARYIRSETSESRARKIFDSIEKNIYLQENVKELLTQFADTKHSMLLERIIKTCPKEYLYLFISNKIVRDPNSHCNYLFKQRSK